MDTKPQQTQKTDTSSPAPLEETRRIRLFDLLTTVLSLRPGTLWWVDEDLWMKHNPRHDPNSERAGHPALYLRDTGRAFESLYEPIPMAIGTSKRSICKESVLVVHGLTEEEPNRRSFFQIRRLFRFTLVDFSLRRRTPPYEMKMRLNLHKPCLDELENQKLRLLRPGKDASS